jgi:hypothetical protein
VCVSVLLFFFQSHDDDPSNGNVSPNSQPAERPKKKPRQPIEPIDKNELFVVKNGVFPFGKPIPKNNPRTDKPDLYFDGVTKWAGHLDNHILEPAKPNSGIRSNEFKSLQNKHKKRNDGWVLEFILATPEKREHKTKHDKRFEFNIAFISELLERFRSKEPLLNDLQDAFKALKAEVKKIAVPK